jgi:hypothetical protein
MESDGRGIRLSSEANLRAINFSTTLSLVSLTANP